MAAYILTIQQNAAVLAYTAHTHRPGWVVEAIGYKAIQRIQHDTARRYSTIQLYSNTAYTVYYYTVLYTPPLGLAPGAISCVMNYTIIHVRARRLFSLCTVQVLVHGSGQLNSTTSVVAS